MKILKICNLNDILVEMALVLVEIQFVVINVLKLLSFHWVCRFKLKSTNDASKEKRREKIINWLKAHSMKCMERINSKSTNDNSNHFSNMIDKMNHRLEDKKPQEINWILLNLSFIFKNRIKWWPNLSEFLINFYQFYSCWNSKSKLSFHDWVRCYWECYFSICNVKNDHFLFTSHHIWIMHLGNFPRA